MDSDRMKEIRRLGDLPGAGGINWPIREDPSQVVRELLEALDARGRERDAASDALGELLDAIDRPEANVMSIRGAVIALESRRRASPWPVTRESAQRVNSHERVCTDLMRQGMPGALADWLAHLDGRVFALEQGAHRPSVVTVQPGSSQRDRAWEAFHEEPMTWICAGCERKHIDAPVGFTCACGSKVR